MDSQERGIVVAFIEPLEGQFDAVRGILTDIIPEVHQEPGCDFYALHGDTRGRLVFIEAWDSREQWVAHSEFDTVARINAQTEGKRKTAIDVVEMYSLRVDRI